MFGDRNVWDDWNNDDHPLESLKACPCCGGEAWLKDDGEMYPEIDSNGAYVGMDIYEGSLFWVECQSCGLVTSAADTPEKAIAKWNQRQAPTIDPVKHGSWQEGCNGDLVCACEQLKAYYLNLCSVCKEPSPHRYRYCPNCGCRMDADEVHLDRLHREMLQECSCETRLED